MASSTVGTDGVIRLDAHHVWARKVPHIAVDPRGNSVAGYKEYIVDWSGGDIYRPSSKQIRITLHAGSVDPVDPVKGYNGVTLSSLLAIVKHRLEYESAPAEVLTALDVVLEHTNI